jgi:hypothetical protein
MGPTQIFRPRWSQIAPFALFGLLFLGLFAATLALPWLDPGTFHSKNGIWLLAFSLPLWGAMTGIAVGAVIALGAIYQVDDAGVTRTTLTGARRYEWQDVLEYSQSGTARDGYRLKLRDGSVLDLHFRYMEDGVQLKQWVERRVLPRLRTPTDLGATIESRSSIAGPTVAIFAVTLLVFGGGSFLAWRDGGSDRLPLVGVTLLILSMGVFIVAFVTSVRTVLLPDRLVRKSCYGERELVLDDVRALRLRTEYARGSGSEWLTIETPSQKLSLSSGTETEFARLRDALRQRCPHALIADDRPDGERL